MGTRTHIKVIWDYYVERLTGYRLMQQGLYARQWQRMCLFIPVSRQSLGPSNLPVQRLLWAVSQAVEKPGHEADICISS